MTVDELYRECSRIIAEAGGAGDTAGTVSDTPCLDARIMIQDALGIDGSAFVLKGREDVGPSDWERILDMAKRRASGTPVAYITGHRGFFMDDFLVTEDTLIPRADTEILVEHAICKAKAYIEAKADDIEENPYSKPSSRRIQAFRMLDLCCGTGCIGISTAKAVSMWLQQRSKEHGVELTLADVSQPALGVCGENASNILNGTAVKWETLCGDLFEPVGDRRFDMIATNPPYIESDVIETLDIQVRKEPLLALDGGTDGLDIIGRIVGDAAQHLQRSGWLLMEIGFDQGQAVKRLFLDAGFTDVSIEKDLGGRNRVVMGRLAQ